MTAVVVVPFGLTAEVAIGTIAITLAAWVVLSAWGQPKAKRIAVAALVAGVLAVATVHANEVGILIKENPCEKYEPWSFLWIAAGCFLP